ncbi:hypothetical protein [Mesorhizobium sp.]|nr:hypothetical protein [Mesorhizobium sp.]
MTWPIVRPSQHGASSSIVMMLDVYSHLFPRGDDGEQMAAAEKLLLG